jgi:signal transduction histidine kinase
VRAPSTLTVALAGAGVIAAIALDLRLVSSPAGFTGFDLDDLRPLLVAACLCAGALLRRRYPAGAWLSAVGAVGMSAIEIVGAVRRVGAVVQPAAWPWLVGVAELALIGAVAIAGGYAIKGNADARADSRAPTTRAWRGVVRAAALGVAVVGAWALEAAFTGAMPAPTAQGPIDELSPFRISGRLTVGFVAVAILAGIWRDLAGPLRRARSKAVGVGDLPRAIGEELLPSASAFRRRGREEERARLAADLHALVLPDLRRAARAAEASGDAGQPLAAELRHAVEGVERLMHERQSVVFEEFGLVAALEWLAERTQEQGEIDVDVELEGAAADPDALPKPVTRAAFRVAILAVDNVLRHAEASRVELRLEASRGSLALWIVDDGRGANAASGRKAGRGLADMRGAARDVGAAVEVRSSPKGTTVEFSWAGADGPALAGEPATTLADSADRPKPPHR